MRSWLPTVLPLSGQKLTGAPERIRNASGTYRKVAERMPAEGWEVPFGCVPETCKENYFIMALHLCAVQFCVTVAKERIGTHTFVDECLKK